MTFVASALLLATVFSVVNFLKNVRAKDWNAVLTQLIVWVGGFGVVWLAAQTILFGDWQVNAHALKLLSLPDLIFVGLNIGSGGTSFNEILKSLDNTNTSATPHLFPRLAKPAPTVPAVVQTPAVQQAPLVPKG